MGAFEELVNGKIFDSLVTPFTTMPIAIGAEIFFTVIWSVSLMLVYMKTKSMPAVMVTAIVTSFAFQSDLMPGTNKFIIALIVAGFIYMMYGLFKSER